MLDQRPALRQFYDGDPSAIDAYGLPLSVKDYGPFVAVRLQRAVLQYWKDATPWAAAGQVVLGNGGDLAKEAGMWPTEAVADEAERYAVQRQLGVQGDE